MWKEISIAKLTYEDNKYWYMIIKENLEKAKLEGCPTMLFENKEEKQISKTLPAIFDDYIVDKDRTDLIKKANIESDDSVFEKLCKATVLDIGKNRFWIKLEER